MHIRSLDGEVAIGIIRRVLGSRAVAALTSPHTVDHYLEHVHPMLTVALVRARVVDVIRETAQASTVVLRQNLFPDIPEVYSKPQPGDAHHPLDLRRCVGRLEFLINLPARRYPEVAHDVHRLVEKYGLTYNTGRLSKQLLSVARQLATLAAKPDNPYKRGNSPESKALRRAKREAANSQ